MDIDFPLVLVLLTFVTGIIWAGDRLLFAAKRVQAAGNEGAGQETVEPWLVETSRSFFPVLAIVLVLRSFLVEPFQIPSGSMLPTLEVGDFILVNKYTYGIRLPVVGTKVMSLGEPERGDIMVFRYPKDGKTNYIKRVIGLPGDKIVYRDKVLTINGEPVIDQHVATLRPNLLFQEQLGEVNHQIYKSTRVPPTVGAGEWVVPEGHYFMMGDNRDNSNDSRFWGMVPDEMIVGKAFAIWMHWTSFSSLPSFSRVGAVE